MPAVREGRRTLLVVDDDPLNADSLALLLRVQGHNHQCLATYQGEPR